VNSDQIGSKPSQNSKADDRGKVSSQHVLVSI